MEHKVFLIQPISDSETWTESAYFILNKEDNWFIKFATYAHVYISNDATSNMAFAIDYDVLFYYFTTPFKNKLEIYNEYN